MKKISFMILMALMVGFLMTSCADSKTFTDKNGKEFTAEPYGWADKDVYKLDTVVYQVNVGNIIWDVILVETVAVPVWLTGWQLYEPVRLKTEAEFLRK